MQEILNNRLIKTEMVEWKKLVPFQPDNLKKTEPYKLQKLANSLCQNGFSMNFYVWEKDGQILIIDGHSRHEVLQLLESGAIYPKNPDGKEYSVTIPEKLPCSFLHLKNKTEAKKAVLIYNSKYKNIDSDILAEWVSDLNLDELKSQIEIPELKLDFDMPQELENDTIDDTAKIKTDIKLGDLIEIGRHRLLCGDSTKKEDVERLMNGAKADMTFTSPPYNMGTFGFGKNRSKYETGNDNIKDYDLFLGHIVNNGFIFSKIVFINIQSNYNNKIDLIKWLYNFKDKLVDIMIWHKKNSMPNIDKALMKDFEFIYIFRENDNRQVLDIYPEKTQLSNVFYLERNRENEYADIHNATFSLKFVEHYLMHFTKKNQSVLEFFTGTGTTMVACQTLDRICYGMELEPLYCQVIINRMRKNFPELGIKVNGKEYKES